jgi:Rha family phage regulatory protein
MNAIALTEFNPFLAVINGTIKTTSLKVAEHFGKRHGDVIRSLNHIECSPEFSERNFALSEYKDASGKSNPYYEMTKDGFTFLAMGFTGKEAAKWKEAYINAFNAMAIQLSTNPLQLPEAKTKKALAGGLSLDQQDTIKALVNGRAEGQPKEKQARIIIQGWSAIKKKFELTKAQTYKNIEPENFVNIISLITRLPIEGELVEKPSIPTDTIAISLNGGTGAMNIIFNGANDSAAQDYYVKICQSEVSITKLCNERFKTTEEIIADLVEDGYIVMKKADLLGRLQA